MKKKIILVVSTAACLLGGCSKPSVQSSDHSRESPAEMGSVLVAARDSAPPVKIRVATYNASLYRRKQGELAEKLSGRKNEQAKQIAEIVQQIRPDILLINEIDHQQDGAPARLLRDNYFGVGQNGREPIDYPFIYAPPSNTGIPSGMDLNNDGKTEGPDDCFGFGTYPGQYAFAVFSRFPIEANRCFQMFRWSNMPGARNPRAPDSDRPYYRPDVWRRLRLSSKNHCDITIQLPGEHRLHFLVSHPTPPVFDGEEDRNGARNHDEIRFWTDYITGTDQTEYIVDDEGRRGGLNDGSLFVLAGDLNSDPIDGDSRHAAMRALLAHPRIHDPLPASRGGTVAGGNGERNLTQMGDPKYDTSQWSSGNYRVDYVLPSSNLLVLDAGVFWPLDEEPSHKLVEVSDHRLVWVDVQP